MLRHLPQAASCRLYLPCNSTAGGVLTDLSGHGNHYTLSGSPLLTPGPLGGAINFVASSSQAATRIADTDFTVVNRTAYSFACWIKASSPCLMFTKYNAGVLGSFYFSYNQTITFHREATGYFPHVSTGSIPFGSWGHVAVTYDGTSVKFYINGRLDRTITDTRNQTDGSSPTGISCYITSGSVSNFYSSSLQDMLFYNGVALTLREVEQLYSMRFIGRGHIL